jgi:amidohydrolase
VKVLLEGEEEIGSRNLAPFIAANRERLAADAVLISDSPMFARGVPSLCYGLRGLCYMEIHVRGAKSDLHSGSFGGAVANPAQALARILSGLKDHENPVGRGLCSGPRRGSGRRALGQDLAAVRPR